MNRRTFLVMFLLPFLALVSSCGRAIPNVDASITAPSSYSITFESIDPINVSEITKVRDITPASDPGLVGELAVSPTVDVLIAVYIGDGTLRRWELGNGLLLFEAHLGVVTAEGLQFSRSGEIVIGATKREIRDEGIGTREYVNDIVIWETQDGQRVRCFFGPCNQPPGDLLGPRDTGVALDGSGQRVIQYSDQSYSLDEFNSNWDTIYADTWVSADAGPEPGIGRIAFDQSGDWFASASRKGHLVIGPFVRKFYDPVVFLSFDDAEIDVPVHDLAFSYDNRWIAGIWGETLVVWDLSQSKDPHIEIQAVGARELAFDRMSNLLFVGGKEGVRILDLRDGSIISNMDSQEVTALSVSPDNRLLLLGDVSGSIQIWAVE